MKSKEATKLILFKLKPLLISNGFDIFEDGIFKAKKEFGIDSIGYDEIEDIGSSFRFSYIVRRRYDFIETFWLEYKSKLGLANQNDFVFVTIEFNKTTIDPNLYKVNGMNKASYEFDKSEVGIEDFVNRFSNDLISIIFPTLLKLEDIKELDLLANKPIDAVLEKLNMFSGNGFIFKKMIISRLANSVDFESVCLCVKNMLLKLVENNELKYRGFVDVYFLLYEKLKTINSD